MNEIIQTDILQFFSQSVDIDGQRVVIDEQFTVPHMLHQFALRDNGVFMQEQAMHDAQFVFGEIDGLILIGKGAFGNIQCDVIDRKRMRGRVFIRALDDALDSGEQDL